ncbi:MAG: hypothetical protein QOH88_867 [Verrucomicrobiota bacterium]|jgi:hypothetical protein
MAGSTVVAPNPIDVRQRRWWCRTSILTAVIFAALLLNNSELLFQSRFYEADDYAANSLQVLKAKQFRETLGNYCRFGFHHPGPAFFYVFGFGEILFFDTTHCVPTPFNGQLIALYALSAFFFSATLTLIAARMGNASPWFVGLALLFAAWHFAAVGKYFEFVPGYLGLLSPWPPCLLVFPFLCFLISAASVAAGNGKDIPLMALAACFLVHGHVAMPLFVGPLALLAYGSLWRESRLAERRPWNIFPLQHYLAAATIVLFLLPIAVDLFTAHPNNLERILEHLGTSYGEGKGPLQSLLYFLHFGAYAGYPSRWPVPTFETFDTPGLISFFLLHWRAYGLWLGSIILFVILKRTEAARISSEYRQSAKFMRRIYLMLIASTGLSLLWGCIQEGPLYDYNSFFNFAIYYAWLLVVSVAAAVWITDRLSLGQERLNSTTRPYAKRIRLLGLITLTLGAVAAFTHEHRRFRGTPADDQQRLFSTSVERGLALDPSQPKFLNFDAQVNAQAERLAVYLERRGIQWWVREDWPLQFGEERIIKAGKPGPPVPTVSSSFWRAALHSNALKESDPRTIILPLASDVDLVIYPGK